MSRFNRTQFSSCIERDQDVPDGVFMVAKSVASSYLAMCKATASWLHPFNTVVPVEHQRVFKHFVAAAVVVLEIRSTGQDVSAKDYVTAQFEGLSWTHKIPFPAQLATPAATTRYLDYVSKKSATQSKIATDADQQFEAYEMEDRKAERLATQMGVSVKRALRLAPHEFTEGYLKYKGVWESVQFVFND